MDFKSSLLSLMDTIGFLPDVGSFEYQRISELFSKDTKSVEHLLEMLQNRKGDEWAWTLARFLEQKIEDGSVKEGSYGSIAIWAHSCVMDTTLKDSLRTMSLRVFFLAEKDIPKKRIFTSSLIESEIPYETLENLVFQLSEDLESFSDEFPKALLKALNGATEWRMGVTWRSSLLAEIAKSPHLAFFLTELKKDEYKTALRQFLDMGEGSTKSFFENLSTKAKTSKFIILFLKHVITPPVEESEYPLFLNHQSYRIKDFQKIALRYVHDSRHSVLDLLAPVLKRYPWDIHAFLASYIRPEEITKLPKVFGKESNYIFWVRDLIEASERDDKDLLLSKFNEIPGFPEKWKIVKKARKKQLAEVAKHKEKEIQDLKNEIVSCIEGIADTHIHPRLVELFDTHEDLFSEEQKAVVKIYLERFFSWELFPLDQITITRQVNENGAKSYHGGVWYMQGFFMLALRVAKTKFGLDFPNASERHKNLVRSIPLVYLDAKEMDFLFDTIGKMSDDDVSTLLSVYWGKRTDDLVSFWGGQNFFPLIERFLPDFSRKANKTFFRNVLKYWIENDWVSSPYEARRAIEFLTRPEVVDIKKDVIYLKDFFEKSRPALENDPSEYLGNPWNPLVAANTELIRLGDKEATMWRLQHLRVKLSVRDPFEGMTWTYARSISQLESEILHDRRFIGVLKNIDVPKYQDELLSIVWFGLSLLKLSRSDYGTFANYLLGGVFEIFKNLSSEAFLAIYPKIESKINESSGDSRHRWNWYLRGLKNHFIEKIQAQLLPLGGVWESTLREEILKDDKWVTGGAEVSTITPDCYLELEKKREECEVLAKEKEEWKDRHDWVQKELWRTREENQELKKVRETFEKQATQKDCVVFVEGCTWVGHIEGAWEGLYPEEEMPFVVQDGYDANHLWKLLSSNKDTRIVIGVFDYDEAWIRNWWKLLKVENTGTFGEKWGGDIELGKCMHKEYINNKNGHQHHALLLPPHFDNVTGKHSPMNASFHAIAEWNRYTMQYMAIEGMYRWVHPDFAKFFDENGLFIEKGMPKGSFHAELLKLTDATDWMTRAILYKNFIPLFGKIREIVTPKVISF